MSQSPLNEKLNRINELEKKLEGESLELQSLIASITPEIKNIIENEYKDRILNITNEAYNKFDKSIKGEFIEKFMKLGLNIDDNELKEILNISSWFLYNRRIADSLLNQYIFSKYINPLYNQQGGLNLPPNVLFNALRNYFRDFLMQYYLLFNRIPQELVPGITSKIMEEKKWPKSVERVVEGVVGEIIRKTIDRYKYVPYLGGESLDNIISKYWSSSQPNQSQQAGRQ